MMYVDSMQGPISTKVKNESLNCILNCYTYWPCKMIEILDRLINNFSIKYQNTFIFT